ncbi:hypothetical protein [Pseudalkalibacillus sp. SCS-8]|uniref:hypothetical protein n=1 Tax=Pseudalkalibacillus nanhaiensis TaxID=3115291 RepID=UPI0032DADD1C
MDWLYGIFLFIISFFILLSIFYIARTYYLNKQLDRKYKLINCGDSGQIFVLRTLQMVLIIFFPLFVLFDDLPNLPSILYLVMHLGLFITQIYSTIYMGIGEKGLRVGIRSFPWEKVDRCEILTGLHEDNHLYPSGGIVQFIIGEKIYRAQMKKKQFSELASFMENHVETDTD